MIMERSTRWTDVYSMNEQRKTNVKMLQGARRALNLLRQYEK